jgi:hypothetical protein
MDAAGRVGLHHGRAARHVPERHQQPGRADRGRLHCYFTASWLALRGAAVLAYDHVAIRAVQIEVMGGDFGFLPFF